MTKYYALTFAVSLGGALLPFINVEAYLLGVYAAAHPLLWALAVAAGLGQTVGKTVLFLCARHAHTPRWLRHQTSERSSRFGRMLRTQADRLRAGWAAVPRPAWWVRFTTWFGRSRAAPAAVVLASASVGVPPLLVTSVAAGRTPMRCATFVVTCLVGRIARFAVLLAAPALLIGFG